MTGSISCLHSTKLWHNLVRFPRVFLAVSPTACLVGKDTAIVHHLVGVFGVAPVTLMRFLNATAINCHLMIVTTNDTWKVCYLEVWNNGRTSDNQSCPWNTQASPWKWDRDNGDWKVLANCRVGLEWKGRGNYRRRFLPMLAFLFGAPNRSRGPIPWDNNWPIIDGKGVDTDRILREDSIGPASPNAR